MISKEMDRDLGGTDQSVVRAHLEVCDDCTNFANQVHALRIFARALVNRAPHARGRLHD